MTKLTIIHQPTKGSIAAGHRRLGHDSTSSTKAPRLAIARTVYPFEYNKNDRTYDDVKFKQHIKREQAITRTKIAMFSGLERWQTRVKETVLSIFNQ